MAFRLVRLSTGDDGQSHVTTGEITLEALDELNAASSVEAVSRVRFEETRPAPPSPGTRPRNASTW